jgi:hypothetical protein
MPPGPAQHEPLFFGGVALGKQAGLATKPALVGRNFAQFNPTFNSHLRDKSGKKSKSQRRLPPANGAVRGGFRCRPRVRRRGRAALGTIRSAMVPRWRGRRGEGGAIIGGDNVHVVIRQSPT